MDDAYFQRTWQDPDPWGFERRWYERRKRAVTIAALPDEHYRHAFEPGCAQGLLTTDLAARCDRVSALELVEAVAERARRRCRDLPHVQVDTGALPERWPDEPVDLVVASEVLYYLSPSGLDRVLDRMHDSLAPDGVVLAVHWTGATDYPQTGDEVHDRLGRLPWLAGVVHHRDDGFRLDAWRRG